MSSPEMKQRVALFALNEMLKSNHFDICKVRGVGEMLGLPYRGEAYDVLGTLHCIDYAKMPKDIRDAIPDLIQQCLGVEPMRLLDARFAEYKAEPIPQVWMTEDGLPPKPRKSFMRLIGMGGSHE